MLYCALRNLSALFPIFEKTFFRKIEEKAQIFECAIKCDLDSAVFS